MNITKIDNFPNTLRAPRELYYFQLLHIMHYILYAIHIYHRLYIICYILHIITSQNVTISTGQFLTGLQILKLCLNNQATSTDLEK